MSVILSFFMSTIGRYVLIALVAGGFLIGIRQQGYNAAMRKCEAATKQRAIEIMQKDIEIGRLQAKEDERILRDQKITEGTDDEFQRKLEEEIAKRPLAARCGLSDADAKRMR